MAKSSKRIPRRPKKPRPATSHIPSPSNRGITINIYNQGSAPRKQDPDKTIPVRPVPITTATPTSIAPRRPRGRPPARRSPFPGGPQTPIISSIPQPGQASTKERPSLWSTLGTTAATGAVAGLTRAAFHPDNINSFTRAIYHKRHPRSLLSHGLHSLGSQLSGLSTRSALGPWAPLADPVINSIGSTIQEATRPDTAGEALLNTITPS